MGGTFWEARCLFRSTHFDGNWQFISFSSAINWTSPWNIWPSQTYHRKNELRTKMFLSFPLNSSQAAAEIKNELYFQPKTKFFLMFSKLNLLNTEQLKYGFVSFFYTIKHAICVRITSIISCFFTLFLSFFDIILYVFFNHFFPHEKLHLFFYVFTTSHLNVFFFTFFSSVNYVPFH